VVLPSLAADTSLLGEWARTVHDETALHGSPNRSGTPVNVLPEETPVRVVAATGSWYRVRLPDGTVGYIVAEDTEPTSEPLRAADAENHAVLAAMANFSGSSGNALAMVAPGTSLEVLGTFGELALVRNGGVSGWVRRTLISGECASGDGTESQNCQQSKLK
jgi:SH3-like domain-containing protein